MKKKLLDILENHVDKVIMGVLAILSLGILWSFVLSGPYGAEVSGRKLGPGEIDQQIAQRAKSLQSKINGEPTIQAKLYTRNAARQFATAMKSSVNLNENINIPIPNKKTVVKEDKRSYEIPSLPSLEDIAAQSIRTAVFMPTQKVDSERTYAEAETEIADIDLVSVQVSFDTAELYDKFEKSFSGESVPAIYRDKELAMPVFAAVRLERQRLLDNGEWSDWQKVGPTKIDSRIELFNVPTRVSQIELGGIDLLLLNFDKFDIMADLLQPLPYDIAASNEEWLAPKYHIELTELLEKQAEEEERRGGRGGRGGRTPRTRPAMNPTNRVDRFDRRRPGTTRPGMAEAKERTEDDIYSDQEFMTLTDDLELGKLKEPIFIWAHDDNVEPDNTYRYRMQVGVFNPVAGKNWSDSEYNDQIILWTDYSNPSEEIKIDPMMYIFPVDLVQSPVAASIQVSKFLQGNWRSETFEVRKGEKIGEKVEVKEDETTYAARARLSRREVQEPKYLDFSTGATLVDIINKGRPSPGRRAVFEIEYTFDGETIHTLPIWKSNWPKEIADKFEEVEKAKEVEVTINETRMQGGRRRVRQNQRLPEEMDDMGMMEMMMMMEGMGMPPGR